MEQHACFNCGKLIDLKKFGCPRCWFMLSPSARSKVYKAFYAYDNNPNDYTLLKLRDAQYEASMELKQ